MVTDPSLRGRAAELRGRGSECGVLDRLVDAVRTGQSRALVVRGEPGLGKTALLDYLAGQASGCRVLWAAGVQSEMELAFAGLHQLLAPMLDHVERLPGPQRDALRTAFGVSAGPAPDRFLVGLAVLSLLSDVAEERPLVCLVDDEQGLDRASAQALAFVARRRELLAIGETARKRTVETSLELTAHEAQVARLAHDGLSSPEIGARLFISARTVQYHLGKVFAKPAISSRSQLDRVLPGDRTPPGRASPAASGRPAGAVRGHDWPLALCTGRYECAVPGSRSQGDAR